VSKNNKRTVAVILLVVAITIPLAARWLTTSKQNQQVSTITIPDAGAIFIGGRIRQCTPPTLLNQTWSTIDRWLGRQQTPPQAAKIMVVEEEPLHEAFR